MAFTSDNKRRNHLKLTEPRLKMLTLLLLLMAVMLVVVHCDMSEIIRSHENSSATSKAHRSLIYFAVGDQIQVWNWSTSSLASSQTAIRRNKHVGTISSIGRLGNRLTSTECIDTHGQIECQQFVCQLNKDNDTGCSFHSTFSSPLMKDKTFLWMVVDPTREEMYLLSTSQVVVCRLNLNGLQSTLTERLLFSQQDACTVLIKVKSYALQQFQGLAVDAKRYSVFYSVANRIGDSDSDMVEVSLIQADLDFRNARVLYSRTEHNLTSSAISTVELSNLVLDPTTHDRLCWVERVGTWSAINCMLLTNHTSFSPSVWEVVSRDNGQSIGVLALVEDHIFWTETGSAKDTGAIHWRSLEQSGGGGEEENVIVTQHWTGGQTITALIGYDPSPQWHYAPDDPCQSNDTRHDPCKDHKNTSQLCIPSWDHKETRHRCACRGCGGALTEHNHPHYHNHTVFVGDGRSVFALTPHRNSAKEASEVTTMMDGAHGGKESNVPVLSIGEFCFDGVEQRFFYHERLSNQIKTISSNFESLASEMVLGTVTVPERDISLVLVKLDEGSEVVGLVYDRHAQQLFWLDRTKGTLEVMAEGVFQQDNKSLLRATLKRGLKWPLAMVLSWAEAKWYIALENGGKSQIVRLNMDCYGGPTVIIELEQGRPAFSLAIHPVSNELYWTDPGSNRSVWRLTNDSSLTNTNNTVNGTDDGEPTKAKLPVKVGGKYPTQALSLAFEADGAFYWTRLHSRKVRHSKLGKIGAIFTGHNDYYKNTTSTTSWLRLVSSTGISDKYYSFHRHCLPSAKSCGHLCLISSTRGSYRCICADGYKINKTDGSSCVVDYGNFTTSNIDQMKVQINNSNRKLPLTRDQLVEQIRLANTTTDAVSDADNTSGGDSNDPVLGSTLFGGNRNKRSLIRFTRLKWIIALVVVGVVWLTLFVLFLVYFYRSDPNKPRGVGGKRFVNRWRYHYSHSNGGGGRLSDLSEISTDGGPVNDSPEAAETRQHHQRLAFDNPNFAELHQSQPEQQTNQT